MRRLLTLLCLLLAALAVPATTVAPAFAKGATSVTVSGPGIDDISLGFTRRADDVDAGTLADASGVYSILGAGRFVEEPDLTPAELGPRYTLTWYEEDVLMIVTHVYPFAEGGAWAEVPDEQQMWGEPATAGWWSVGDELGRQLVSLGAPEPAATTEDAADPESAAGTVTTPTPPPASSGFPVVATGAAVLAGLALLAGSVWWVRRRRTPAPV